MIISASRRTDIPAFFSEWFMNRIRAGYCTAVNPFNRKQVSYISLKPEDVDIIVFWTKNPKPLMPHLNELNDRGFKFYFQYTLTGYDRWFEPNLPNWERSCETFQKLSEALPSGLVVWRYDPIIISNRTDEAYHLKRYAEIAATLKGYTERNIISLVDDYRKASAHFKRLKEQGIYVENIVDAAAIGFLIKNIAEIARENSMEIFSCAEPFDLMDCGVQHGKCIDDDYIQKHFGIVINEKKDNTQRIECGCIKSKDIGHYDTCQHGCAYCYAGTLPCGIKNMQLHNPESPSLLGYFDAVPSTETKKKKKLSKQINQGTLF
ncbi:MAG: hypothetical protein H6Q66_2068 [Firmicutes bacterium]|nr:hypothetical protein [Bacillota bacterium]